MQLAFHRIDALPRLAWCAELRQGHSTVKVRHGPWVETGADFFVEGAWDQAFEAHRFDMAQTFTGSGGRILGRRIVFASFNPAEKKSSPEGS